MGDNVDTNQAGTVTDPAQTVASGKGKGKAVDTTGQDVSMGEEDSSSDEATGAEDEVSQCDFMMLWPKPREELTRQSLDQRRAYATSVPPSKAT